jgi:hypothetical protein
MGGFWRCLLPLITYLVCFLLAEDDFTLGELNTDRQADRL